MALLPPPPAKYKATWIACVVALALFIVAAIFGDHGLMHVLRLRDDQRQLERLAFELAQRNEQLRARIRRLQTEDWYVEKLARERLGMTRPGELVYRVVPPRSRAAD